MSQPRPRRALRRLALLALAGCTFGAARAQLTESPQTIAPGKVLFEIDGVRLSYDRADAAGNKHTAVAVASTIVSSGLTDTLDVQVGVDLFLREKIEFRGGRDSSSGIGNTSLRFKWTFWRDERSGAAAAVIPYVRLPTSTGAVGSEHVEGGFIVPWAISAPGGFTAGAMFQWDHRRNDAGDGYDAHWIVSGFAQRALTRRFSVYAEAEFAVASTGFSDRAGSLGAGLLFQFTNWLQFDYELLRGLNRGATDWTHVARVNWVW